jgi:hypothetical protein
MKLKHLTAVALALGLSGLGALAQQDDGPPQGPPPDGANQGPPDGMPPQGGPRRGFRRPPPIIAVLDTNRDGIIDADEIANAPTALKTLDRDGKGYLTMMDVMGPPPRRGGMGMQGQGFGPGPGQGPGPQGGQGPDGGQGPGMGPDGGPPPGPPEGTNGVAGGPGPGRGMRRVPPVFAALDTNHDGKIDASEIANASAALKTLDKEGTGQLTVMELLGPPPRRGMGMGPGGGPGFGPGPGQGPGPDGGQGPGPDGGQGPDGPPPGGGPDGGQMPPPGQQ